MMRINVRCLGIAPLIMNQAGPERLIRWMNSPGDQAPLPDREQDFQSRIYRDPGGRVAIPSDMLMGALKVAGQDTKLGRIRITGKDSTLLTSILRIRDEWVPIDGGEVGTEPEFVSDRRLATFRQGRRRTRVPVIRPKIMSWGFQVTIEAESGALERTARQLFDRAGTEAGLGDFRPSLPNNSGWKSPFGRFQVVTWTSERVTEATELNKLVYETI